MRHSIYISIFISLLFSCTEHDKLPRIKELKYSAYTWYLGKDSVEFYLAYYLEIKDGQCLVMRHDSFMGEPGYFKVDLTDSLHKTIDTVFAEKDYASTYLFDTSDLKMYDGFYYAMDVINTNGQRKIIQFVPEESPEEIQMLCSVLDTLVLNATDNTDKTAPFNVDEYKNELESLVKKDGPKMPMLRKAPPVQIQK